MVRLIAAYFEMDKDIGFDTDSSPIIANGILYIGSTYGYMPSI